MLPVRRPIQRNIAGTLRYRQPSHRAIFHDGELERQFPFLHLSGFRNQPVPILAYILQARAADMDRIPHPWCR